MIPTGREAKHGNRLKPSSPPAFLLAVGSSGEPPNTRPPLTGWPGGPGSTGLAGEDCRSPFSSPGLCQSPSIPEADRL